MNGFNAFESIQSTESRPQCQITLVSNLDTSALLKRYRTEDGTKVLDTMFSTRTRDEFFITSHFTAVEVESVAARALKGRLLNKKAHAVLLSLFANDLKHVLIVLPVRGCTPPHC